MEKNKKLFLILVTALIIRGFGLKLMLIDDEIHLSAMFSQIIKGDYPFTDLPFGRVLLSSLFFLFRNTLFDLTGYNIPLRTFPLFFGLLTIYLTYKLAERIYGDKIALISAFILALWFNHIWASLQYQMDGSVIVSIFIATIYSYTKFKDNGSTKWLITTAFLTTLGLFFKYTMIMVLPILALYELMDSRTKNLMGILQISIISLLFFSIFPITTYLLGKPEIFLITVKWGLQNTPLSERTAPHLLNIIIKNMYTLIEYGTPLLVFLPLFGLLSIRNKAEHLFSSWILVVLFFLIFVIPGAPIARHQMLLIPPLAILAAKVISRIEVNSKVMGIGFLSLVLFSAILFGLNAFSSTLEPLTFTKFDASLLPKNPDVWYTGFSGPLFKISSISLFFTVFLAALFFTIFLVSKEPSRKTALILLITVSFAFNVLLVEEFLFARFSPNYNEVMRGMVDYYHENELTEPVYSKFEDLAYYVGAVNLGNGKLYNSASAPKSRELMRTEGGTVMWLNLPPVFEGGPFWRTLENIKSTCELEKTFYSKGYEAGYIFICPSERSIKR